MPGSHVSRIETSNTTRVVQLECHSKIDQGSCFHDQRQNRLNTQTRKTIIFCQHLDPSIVRTLETNQSPVFLARSTIEAGSIPPFSERTLSLPATQCVLYSQNSSKTIFLRGYHFLLGSLPLLHWCLTAKWPCRKACLSQK